MRTLASLFLVFPLFADTPLTTQERARLVSHLEMTEQWIADEVKSLSDKQLKWRASDESWSVLDVIEHLAVAEPQYWAQFQDSMKKPVTDFKAPRTLDADMLWYGIDRTRRNKTGEARTAKGRYTDLATPLGEFRKLRAQMLDTAKNSQEDMRGRRFLDSGQDCYQWFVMITSHSMRHILQIREIKQSPNFPKG